MLTNKPFFRWLSRTTAGGIQSAIIAHAENWANAMESYVRNGKRIQDIHEFCREHARKCDAIELSGGMENAALNYLLRFWKFAPTLKKALNK